MITIYVHMKDGRVFEYDVADVAKAREHVYRIANEGFRHNTEGKENVEFTFYPVHKIEKVVFIVDKADYEMLKYPVRS